MEQGANSDRSIQVKWWGFVQGDKELSRGHVRLFATLWTIACQGPLSMGFSRQEYWSGFPCPSPGYLFNPAIKPASLMSPALAVRFFTTRASCDSNILEWLAFLFSRGSSQSRDRTQVSCIVGRFFTTREVQKYWSGQPVPFPADVPDQELNWGLLHCRRILYQLSYEGSPSSGCWQFDLWFLCLF